MLFNSLNQSLYLYVCMNTEISVIMIFTDIKFGILLLIYLAHSFVSFKRSTLPYLTYFLINYYTKCAQAFNLRIVN